VTQHQVVNDSPYARAGLTLVDQGYAAIPCRPGSKVPGAYRCGEWFYESDWTRFCERLPTDIETDIWSKWPDAGLSRLSVNEHRAFAFDNLFESHRFTFVPPRSQSEILL